jgi:hypothetical protein
MENDVDQRDASDSARVEEVTANHEKQLDQLHSADEIRRATVVRSAEGTLPQMRVPLAELLVSRRQNAPIRREDIAERCGPGMVILKTKTASRIADGAASMSKPNGQPLPLRNSTLDASAVHPHRTVTPASRRQSIHHDRPVGATSEETHNT